MKALVFVLTVLSSTFAIPNLDWSQIKPKDAYVDPLPNVTVSLPQERIIGGTEVTRNSIPYQVALIINGASFCGGSVISNTWVLTAAHCTASASYIQLTYGAHNIQSSESTQVVVTSTNFISHAQYNPSTLTNDIALVKSPSTVSLNNNIRTIPLAPASSGNFAGSTALLTGWGRTSDSSSAISPVLRQVRLSIIANAVCSQTFGSIIQSSTICTSGSGTIGACNGDSGGPLVLNGIQVGVTSFVSSRGCQSGLPSGFIRVSSFRNWITQNSGI